MAVLAESSSLTTEQLLDQSLHFLGLNVRTVAALENDDRKPNRYGTVRQITTIRQLLQCRPHELLAIPNFGEKTLDDVYRGLAKLGFRRGNQCFEPSDDDRRRDRQQRRRATLLTTLGYQGSVPIHQPREED